MSLVKDIAELIKRGEALAPKGGSGMDGYNGEMQPQYISWRFSWRLESISIINELGADSKTLLRDIENDNQSPYFYESSAKNILGALKAAKALAIRKEKKRDNQINKSSNNSSSISNKVFIVHGRDEEILHQLARFLEKLDIDPIILFEKPDKGQTIIEKLEANSNVAFAVILMTPDDQGKLASEEDLKPRARQNVVLELGYFVGKLGRQNVAVLFDKSVELPSDYHGVEYIPIDASNAWHLNLAKEMKAAGLSIDLNNVI